MVERLYENGGGNWVTCPACDGKGYQIVQTTETHFLEGRDAFRTQQVARQRPCFSCLTKGKVEAYRVCPNCHNFTDICLCEYHKIISVRRLEIVMSDNVSRKSDVPGVTWDKHNNIWRVQPTIGGEPVYLGTFAAEEQDLAEGIAREARRLPADQILLLKQQYKELKAQRRLGQGSTLAVKDSSTNGHRLPAHAVVAELVAIDDPQGLHLLELVKAAKAADDHARQMAERATRAADEAQQATQEAIDAWNRLAEALCGVAEASPSFMQSLLGRGG